MHGKFLDQTAIFMLLYNGNVSAAKQLFQERFCKFQREFTNAELRDFLHSLNLGIYHFILFYEHTSLEECCCKNHQIIRTSESAPAALCEAGAEIIHNYGYCTDYLINRYTNAHIRDVLKYIHQNLSEHICLKQLAKHAGLSKNQLCFLFKEETGRTICRYIVERRIVTAKELLQKRSLSMEFIATLCGFSSASYFCTIFRQETGQTPLQYRKGLSENNRVKKVK